MDFRLFGIPVHVSPFFLIIAGFIAHGGLEGVAQELVALAIGAGIVFLGVLAHELGHAFAGRAFGLEPRIMLHGFGGLTSWPDGRRLSPWRSIAVSFAGPMVGIVLGGAALVLGAAEVFGGGGGLGAYAVRMFVFVNLGWGVLNLIPMMPLDGGNILASFFEVFAGGRGRVWARILSLVIAAALIALALYAQDLWILVIVGFLSWINFKGLRAERQLADDMPLLDELQDVRRALARGEVGAVVRRATELRSRARTPIVQAELDNLIAWGLYLGGDPAGALRVFQTLPAGRAADPALHGALLVETGRPAEAIAPLELALARGSARFVDEKLAAALIASRRFDYAAQLYSQDRGEHASREAVEAVRDAARSAGALDAASALDDVLASRRPS